MSIKFKFLPIMALCLSTVVLSDARADIAKTCEEAAVQCINRVGKGQFERQNFCSSFEDFAQKMYFVDKIISKSQGEEISLKCRAQGCKDITCQKQVCEKHLGICINVMKNSKK